MPLESALEAEIAVVVHAAEALLPLEHRGGVSADREVRGKPMAAGEVGFDLRLADPESADQVPGATREFSSKFDDLVAGSRPIPVRNQMSNPDIPEPCARRRARSREVASASPKHFGRYPDLLDERRLRPGPHIADWL